ncbi:MAG: phenylalanine--tRNA ligase subunit alpha, partial [Planctomycetes bacterium]|nr:phenylalanine--tRNA ligase subunit alpha [Planctomycetota bacterium]
MDERREEWLAAIAAAGDADALRRIDAELFGKDGAVTGLVKSVSTLPKDERPAAGKAANLLKQELSKALEDRRSALDATALAAELEAPDFDPTEPGPKPLRGTLHPITVVRDELVDLFTSMGFTWQDGPEVESDFFNFEALNIPADHPARDSQDTFWLDDGNLLRTHTSPVQIRTMRKMKPPLKVIVPGRCFRQETVDATHEHTFYQMEGLVVDKGVSTANLLHTMKTCLREILRRDLVVRCRPGFFPFVEPGFELDVKTERGWMEILPCGMVHPRVLEAGGIDPEEYTGFAFGMGLTRVVM